LQEFSARETIVFAHRLWSKRFKSEFVPQLNLLVEALEARLLPTLKDTDISHEAEGVKDETWQNLMSMPARDDIEMSDLAEIAEEAGVSHYMMLSRIRQGLINMFTAGLYHTFEQQLLLFHRKEVLEPAEENEPSLFKVTIFKERLASRNIDVEKFRCWSKVDELRLAANTVKHAEGESAMKLRTVRPDLFIDPMWKNSEFTLLREPTTNVFLPLLGEDIFITMNDLHMYRDAVVDFWADLSNAIKISTGSS